VADGALKEIKRLHKEAKSKAKLIAGFAHMDEPMTTAVANPDTRRSLARNMAAWAIERGYDGIDIDWEYPDTWEQWQHLGYFIADLREELSGTAMSISIASSVTYKVPNYWTTDQLDFLMTMSYDDLADQHSSMQRFQGDANKCLNDFHMPKQRIVVGLPFYSNQQGTLTTQYGYSQIIAWYPRMKPSENVFRSKNQDGSDGPMHSFNGPDLIAEKCRWLKQAKFGGVMIWAYDTDLPLKHKASLAKAMYKVIRQPKKKSEEKDSAK
jgi:GH18 family chitinase